MKNKSKAKRFLVIIVISFVVYNIFWISWRSIKYKSYTKDFEEFQKGVSYIKTYDGYDCNVKYPDYLMYTGNLGISSPDHKTSLVIWPQITGKYKIGVQINREGEIYSINLNELLKPEDPYFTDIVIENKEIINDLKEKAEDVWSINFE